MLVWRYRRLSHVADTVRPAREPILDRLMNEVITEARRMARRVFKRVDAFNVSVVKVREEEREGWTSLGLMLLSFKASKSWLLVGKFRQQLYIFTLTTPEVLLSSSMYVSPSRHMNHQAPLTCHPV